MTNHQLLDLQQLSRYVGWALISTIVIGILSALFISSGININLSADVAATAENMLGAEQRLHAKAYMSLLLFLLEVFISVGLFFILRGSGLVIATWSLLLGVTAGLLTLFGAVNTLNVSLIAENVVFQSLVDTEQRLLLASVQVISEYTSFHLAIVLSSLAKAGSFLLFFRSRFIPRLISAWGIFASLFVATTIVARDFIPFLGGSAFTSAFMLCNLIALVSLGIYMGVCGVRNTNRDL